MSDQESSLPPPIPDGTALFYQIGDAGMDYPAEGLSLSPGDPVTVGEDLPGDFARILVDRNILGDSDPAAPKNDAPIKADAAPPKQGKTAPAAPSPSVPQPKK